MILDEINKANVQAIKEKDVVARNIYSVIKSKAMLETVKKREKGEQLCDVDMVAIIQKTLKELEEEGENYKKAGNNSQYDEITTQKNLIEKFLPQMMSADEIRSIIMSLEDKSVPSVMKHFKQNYAGKCDMRTVSQIIKEFQ